MNQSQSSSSKDAEEQSGTGKFLFVNDSTSKAGKKVGRRADIKSHVRNHIVQRDKKGRSPKKYGEAIAFRSKVDTLESVSQVGTSTASSNDGSTDQTQRRRGESSHLVYPSFTSTPGSSLANSGYLIQTYNQTHATYPASYDTCLLPEMAWANANENEGRLKHIRADYEDRRFKQAAEEAARWQAFISRPLDQLGNLGNGRVDPFSAYPTVVKDTKGMLDELVDHTVTYLLPGLLADENDNTDSSIASSWMSSGLKSPLLFHALVFAGSIHLSYLRTSTIHPNSTISLTHKTAAIQQLNESLCAPTEHIRDEIISAILILSSHEIMDVSLPEETCFNSPLRKMQWLNVYGNIRNAHEYLQAVLDLVTIRGGVESLELYGLAEILICGDVIAATTYLCVPAFQPLLRSKQWLQTVLDWARSPPRLPYMILGSAFKQYLTHGLTSEMLILFDDISAVTISIEHHLSGEPRGLPLALIARTRTACQQRLLFLPPASEVLDIPQRAPNVYEAVRLTALVYGIGILFPTPRSFSVLQTLVQQLVIAIEEAEIEKYGEPIADLLLWMLILGGIAALDKVDLEWFVERLVVFSRRWGLRGWSEVEVVMGRYLWLDSACGGSGRRIWAMVGERRVFLEAGEWLGACP